ncbi:MAG: NAD-dependent epimerase/dehydratase family protein [Clostridiales bacterium]|nr:NAD-dependent epimerase/dehydratase family protein [Clostridiales bacterium]
MKVTVTGKTSYIGINIKSFFEERGHICETISLREGTESADFSKTDIVVHCVGAVHKNVEDSEEYFERINVSLTVETAKKAKASGVKQFIFFSSMSVYGGKVSMISADTAPDPVTPYGKSKLLAEKELFKLSDDDFTVAVLRPPMVYGKGCPGNYSALRKIVIKSPIFPKVSNKKSLLYIKNLCFFIFYLAENRKGGIFLPMDGEYVSTDFLAKNIAEASGKKIKISKLAGFFIKIFKNAEIVRKAFGSLYYDESCADKIDFIDVRRAILETESTESEEKTGEAN